MSLSFKGLRDRALRTWYASTGTVGCDAWPWHFLWGAEYARAPFEQYRLEGESVVCERITPNARSSGASHIKHLQSWTVGDFLIANVLPRAKASFQQILSERHAKRS